MQQGDSRARERDTALGMTLHATGRSGGTDVDYTSRTHHENSVSVSGRRLFIAVGGFLRGDEKQVPAADLPSIGATACGWRA